MGRRRTSMIAAIVFAVGGLAVLGQQGALGVQTEHDVVVSDDPVNFTPHVLDGEVFAVAEVGNTVVLGGAFTQARNAPDGSPVLARHNLLAYDKTTGEISTTFTPDVNDVVRTLAPGPDGTSVYVGGKFGAISGVSAFKIARLDVTTGAKVAGFNPPVVNAAVMDARYASGRLFIGGLFTDIGGTLRTYLAELNPSTGALKPDVNLAFAGLVWGGTGQVYKFDVSPDGNSMVVLGNFRTIDGQTRVQVGKIDISTSPATVMNWATSKYDIKCGSSNSTKFDVRDVDIAPDGSYFAIAATGGHTPIGGLCDGVSRWEMSATGTGQEPTWFDLTGGDSLYSVAVTGTAIYVGGHLRWLNNPVYISSFKGPGAVDREGIAALDPVNGLPLSWNPGRDRGLAVWDIVGTDSGVYIGNDTDRIALEYHGKHAKLPLAGGWIVPQPHAAALPVKVHLANPSSNPDQLMSRSFDGSAGGELTSVPGAGTGWNTVRGGFVAAGELYTAKSNQTFTARSYDGTTFGTERTVPLNGLNAFGSEAASMTGLTYDNGRMFFTQTDQNSLFMRYFSAESEIIGATKFTVTGGITGVDWRNVKGLFLTDDHLYWVHKDNGSLHRLDWANNAPVSGTDTVIGAGIDWRSSALFTTPAPVASSVSFVAKASNPTQTTSNSVSLTLPGSVQAGDTMVMFLSSNSATSTATDPAGWTRLGQVGATSLSTVAWERTATAGDAGAVVTVNTSEFVRSDLVASVYRGAAVPAGGHAFAAEALIQASHITPQLTVSVAGSWVVSYWSDKTAATTSWTAPGSEAVRHMFAGSGAGHVSELLTDSGVGVPTGTVGGLSATADSATKNATMVSVLLEPSP